MSSRDRRAVLGRISAGAGAIGVAAAIAVLSVGGSAAAATAKHRAHAASEPTFIVGQQESGIVSLSADTNAFKGAPYHVKFAYFSYGPPEVAAASAGKIDLADLGDVPPITGAGQNLNFKLVAAEVPPSYKQVGDFIIVPKGSPIKSISQLKGKSIGVPFGSSANGYALNAIEAAGLTPKEVKLVNLTPAAAQTAFQSGSVQAIALWNPQITVDVQAGAKVIGYGRPPQDPDVEFYLANTKDLTTTDKTRRADLVNLLERLGAAYQWGDAHQSAWEQGLEHETGINAATAKIVVPNGLEEVRPITPQIIKNVQILANTFYKAKQISKAVKISDFVDNILPANYVGKVPSSK